MNGKKNFSIEILNEDLNIFEDRLLSEVHAPLEQLTQIGERLILSGGKRLRPSLLFLSAYASAPSDFDKESLRETILPLAMSLELIHMATLMHDDVLDASETRRFSPTVNKLFGNQIAILSGDYFFAKALLILLKKNYPSEIHQKLVKLIMDLVVGEIGQDAHLFFVAKNFESALKNYEDRIAKKTANFFALCCELGASFSQKESQKFFSYGLNFGMAFQIIDDVLNFTEQEEKIGKPSLGSDLQEGILTLPVLYTIFHDEHGKDIQNMLRKKISHDEFQKILEWVKKSGGIEFAKEQAKKFLLQAQQSLPSEKNAYTQTLHDLAEKMLVRQF